MVKLPQFNFRQQTYRVTFSIKFLLFTVIVFGLLCKLGFWQLHRYSFKKNIQQTFHERLSGAPVNFMQLDHANTNLQFQKVVAEGKYLNELTVLLQNQFYQDRLGYDVLTPLQIPGEKKLLLVDRGWIQKNTDESLPNIPDVKNTQQIKGYIKTLDERQFILGKNILNPTIKPVMIQRIDIKELSELFHQEFYPFIVRLDPSQADGFTRNWTINSVMPAKHMGYAVQWFLMAFIFLIACFIYSCERVKNGK